MLIVETIPISSYGPGSPFPPEYGDWWSPYSHNTILLNCSKDALCLETLLGESYFACGAGSQLHRLLTDNTYFSLLGRSDSQYIWDQLVLLKLLFYGRGHCLAAVHAPSLINQLEGASCRSRSRKRTCAFFFLRCYVLYLNDAFLLCVGVSKHRAEPHCKIKQLIVLNHRI